MESERERARLWLTLAQEKLEVARELLGLSRYDDVVSKAYYVMFYAAKAALASYDIDARRHSGVIALFGQQFVKVGRVDAYYLQLLTRAMQAREISDYDPSVRASRQNAEEAITYAEQFLNKVIELLSPSG